MNIKPKTAVLAILALSTVSLATAKAPEIDPARIDSMVAEVLRQADQHPNQTAKPDGQAIRKDVVKRLQTLEILKMKPSRLVWTKMQKCRISLKTSKLNSMPTNTLLI